MKRGLHSSLAPGSGIDSIKVVYQGMIIKKRGEGLFNLTIRTFIKQFPEGPW
jgi:hypothetical protein